METTFLSKGTKISKEAGGLADRSRVEDLVKMAVQAFCPRLMDETSCSSVVEKSVCECVLVLVLVHATKWEPSIRISTTE